MVGKLYNSFISRQYELFKCYTFRFAIMKLDVSRVNLQVLPRVGMGWEVGDGVIEGVGSGQLPGLEAKSNPLMASAFLMKTERVDHLSLSGRCY